MPVLGKKLKLGLRIFFNIDLCSAISMESSSRDLLNDVAEYRPTLKNKQNTYNPYFTFIPKTGIELPKTGTELHKTGV